MTGQIVIACSVRPDNNGNANGADLKALQACQQLFSNPVKFGKASPVDIVVRVRKVPDVERPADAAGLQGERANFLQQNVKAQLAGVSLLYIPGAPVAPMTQATNAHGMRAESAFKKAEALSRDAFESALIEAALTIGIPILAVCAGSWRLLEAFGGGVRELTGNDVARHYANSWACNHGLHVEEGSDIKPSRGIIANSASIDGHAGPNFLGANSTHWAVANTDSSGNLAKHGSAQTLASKSLPPPVPRPIGNPNAQLNPAQRKIARETLLARNAVGDTPGRGYRNPAQLLDVMVREGTQANPGTVEGFESASGAPVIGVQWHPESFLPGMKGHGERYKNDATIAFSQNIFMNMVLAAVASQTRRTDVIPALKEAFEKTSKGLRHVPEEDKHHSAGIHLTELDM